MGTRRGNEVDFLRQPGQVSNRVEVARGTGSGCGGGGNFLVVSNKPKKEAVPKEVFDWQLW